MARKIWGDTMRVEVGAHHRASDLDDEISTDDWREDPEITKPHELLELPPTTHVTMDQYINLWHRVDRMKFDAKRNKRSTANQLLAAIGKRPPEQRMRSLERKMKIIWGLLVAALGLAGAELKQIVNYIGDARETQITIRQLVDSRKILFDENKELNTRLHDAEEKLTRSVQRLDDINSRRRRDNE